MAGTHRPGVTAIPLGRPSPGASSNQPERPGQRTRPCGARGPARRSYSVLLPAGLALPPTLPPARCALTAPFHPCRPLKPCGPLQAVCFLWRFPWGRPRRTLSGAASVWSPDFPPLIGGGRPADWLRRDRLGPSTGSRTIDRGYRLAGPRSEERSPGSFIEASLELWDCAGKRGLTRLRGRPAATAESN